MLISYLTIQLLHQKLRLIRPRKHFPTFCCSPSAFRFGVLYVQSSSSASVILLHTLNKTSGYLSYCYLLISSRQCGHSPLTSCINKIFLPKELQITEYFCHLLYPLIVQKPCPVFTDQKIKIYSDYSVGHKQPYQSQICHLSSLSRPLSLNFSM